MEEHPLYRVYSQWLKERYGSKVYKLPVNVPVSCPNRDGAAGEGGCIYCGAKGGGNETLSDALSVAEQVEKNRAYIAKRYKAKLFIPYFQSFTNTYCSAPQLERWVREAVGSGEGIAGVAISTRPDCISGEQLDFLSRFQQEKQLDVSIELGLQTANYKTLKILNRRHSLADYIEAAAAVKGYGLQLCTHVILDLPWDDRDDVVETAGVVSAAGSDFVKCHALYVERRTALADMYLKGEISLFPKEEYIERCILFLTHLNPDMVVQRIIGRAPEADSIITNWNTSWWKIKESLEERMRCEGVWQGKNFHEKQEIIRAKWRPLL
ncbi:TIGR01212 family radical SAM protein [Eubacterium sp. AM05-23]|nr:TIGR01212 family radical SAM protein [Eubacterium sp. AM05-23]RHO60654.1 TIGR01212 family radical SAM protein [Eubacterium sp. AM05-23]